MEWLDQYEVYLSGTRLAAGTQRNRYRMARRLGSDPRAWTQADVMRIMNGQGKASSAREVLRVARAVVRDLRRLGVIEHDPTLLLEAPRVGRYLPRPVDERSAAQLLQLSPPISHWAVLGMFAGLRRAEVCRLEGADLLDLAAGPTLRVLGKGGTDWLIPAHPKVIEVVEGYGHGGRLWPVGPNRFSHLWQRAMDDAGLRVRFHSLRHWYGTAAYEATGADLLTTAAMLRHANPSTTAIYAKVRQERAYDAIGRIA